MMRIDWNDENIDEVSDESNRDNDYGMFQDNFLT